MTQTGCSGSVVATQNPYSWNNIPKKRKNVRVYNLKDLVSFHTLSKNSNNFSFLGQVTADGIALKCFFRPRHTLCLQY